MSHASMTQSEVKLYKKSLGKSKTDDESLGYFSHIDSQGHAISKLCIIVDEFQYDYYIRYLDDKWNYVYSFIDKNKVTRHDEVEELSFFVIKHKLGGIYHTTAKSPSSAPQLYLTKGKAEKLRKQKSAPDDWVVMKWTISENEA